MAIRNIVTRGFGNGTYAPGIRYVPTRGYLADLTQVPPACWPAGDVYLPGFKQGQTIRATGCGFREGAVYLPGFKAGQSCSVAGFREGDVYLPGFREGGRFC